MEGVGKEEEMKGKCVMLTWPTTLFQAQNQQLQVRVQVQQFINDGVFNNT